MSWEFTTRYWFKFTKDFRTQSLWNAEDSFQQIWKALKSEESELLPLQIHLLAFLPQNMSLFFPKDPSVKKRFIDFLQDLLRDGMVNNNAQLRLVESVMTALTCILLQLPLLGESPGSSNTGPTGHTETSLDGNATDEDISLFSWSEQIETLIETLLEIIRGACYSFVDMTDPKSSTPSGGKGSFLHGLEGKSQERSLRLLATESLRNIEEAFPGILSPFLQEIIALGEREATYASSSFQLLIATLLSHGRHFPSSFFMDDSLTTPLREPQDEGNDTEEGEEYESDSTEEFTVPNHFLFSVPSIEKQDIAHLNVSTMNSTPYSPDSCISRKQDKRVDKDLIFFTDKHHKFEKKAIRFLVSNLHLHSPWMISSLFQLLMPLCTSYLELEEGQEQEETPMHSLFHDILQNLYMCSQSTIQGYILHMYLTLSPKLFPQTQLENIQHLFVTTLSRTSYLPSPWKVISTSIIEERKLLSLFLLKETFTKVLLPQGEEESLPSVDMRIFYPQSSDSLPVRFQKLELLHSLDSSDRYSSFPKHIGIQRGLDSELGGRKLFSESILSNLLETCGEFQYFPSTCSTSLLLNNFLRLLLLEYSTPGGQSPNLLKFTCSFIRNLLLESPRFLPLFLRLLNDSTLSLSTKKDLSHIAFSLLFKKGEYRKEIEQEDKEKYHSASSCDLLVYLPLVLALLKDETIDAVPLVNLLHSILEDCLVLAQPPTKNWELGNTLLSAIRDLFISSKERNFPSVSEPLKKVLVWMMENWSFLDIRDRASLFLQLVTRIPNSSLLPILQHQHLRAEDSSLGSTKNIKKEELVNPLLVREDTSPPGPILLECSLVEDSQSVKEDFFEHLSLKVTPFTGEPFSGDAEHPSDGNNVSVSDKESLLSAIRQHYFSSLDSSHATDFIRKIFLSVRCSHVEENEGTETIYALTIQIKPQHRDCKELYKPFPSLQIPFMQTSSPPLPFSLQLSLKKPLPTEFSVEALFHREDGTVEKESLLPISVPVEQLLFPVPLESLLGGLADSFNENLSSVLPSSHELHRYLFDSLWSEEGEFSLESEKEGTSSLKVLAVHSSYVRERLLLSPLCQLKVQFEDNPEGRIDCLALLPSKYHLAMKFSLLPNQCQVEMKTNFWPILSFVDSYLEVLFG